MMLSIMSFSFSFFHSFYHMCCQFCFLPSESPFCPSFYLYLVMQTHYALLLCAFKDQLQQHVRVHAMEAVMACWELEQSLQSLTGI